MARRLFTLLSALSLLLCAAVVVLWVRSNGREDRWRWGDGPPRFSLSSYRGGVTIISDDSRPKTRSPATGRGWGTEYEWRRLGFGAGAFRYGRWADDPSFSNGGYQKWLRFPYWTVCLVLSLPPLLYWWRMAGRPPPLDQCVCRRCGYDLRATPGRCPECGTAAAGKEA